MSILVKLKVFFFNVVFSVFLVMFENTKTILYNKLIKKLVLLKILNKFRKPWKKIQKTFCNPENVLIVSTS